MKGGRSFLRFFFIFERFSPQKRGIFRFDKATKDGKHPLNPLGGGAGIYLSKREQDWRTLLRPRLYVNQSERIILTF